MPQLLAISGLKGSQGKNSPFTPTAGLSLSGLRHIYRVVWMKLCAVPIPWKEDFSLQNTSRYYHIHFTFFFYTVTRIFAGREALSPAGILRDDTGELNTLCIVKDLDVWPARPLPCIPPDPIISSPFPTVSRFYLKQKAWQFQTALSLSPGPGS